MRISDWSSDVCSSDLLDMAMAYFSPGQGMLRRLGRVARRGRARFVMAGKSDNPATIGASRLLYGYLLRKADRKSVVVGKGGAVRVDLGCRRFIKKKIKK